jgi:hypothetical protein
MTINFSSNAKKEGIVALPLKAFDIVKSEAKRRAIAGEPSDTKKAVAGEYIIAHHASLGGRGEGV